MFGTNTPGVCLCVCTEVWKMDILCTDAFLNSLVTLTDDSKCGMVLK